MVATRASLRNRVGAAVDYIGSADTTLTGSRSGHAPLLIWYALQHHGIDGLRARAEQARQVAAYTVARLGQAGWPAWRHPHEMTVVLDAPPEPLRVKWRLATSNGRSHIICLPGITNATIDAFIEDLTDSPTADINLDAEATPHRTCGPVGPSGGRDGAAAMTATTSASTGTDRQPSTSQHHHGPPARPDPALWERPDIRAALAVRDITTLFPLLGKQGITQRRLAALVEMSQSEISEIVKGRQVRFYDVLTRIADGLSIPRAYLGLADPPAPSGVPCQLESSPPISAEAAVRPSPGRSSKAAVSRRKTASKPVRKARPRRRRAGKSRTAGNRTWD